MERDLIALEDFANYAWAVAWLKVGDPANKLSKC